MLKFCANLSMLFTEQPLHERFRQAKQHCFDAVEVQFPYSLAAADIKQALDDNGLSLVLFNIDADDLLQGGEGLACVPEKRGQFQEALNQALEYARILKPAAVNILPGRCFQPERHGEYLQTYQDNVRLAADALAAIGVKAVFEAINHHDMPGFIIPSGAAMLDLWDKLQHPNLSMQVDAYHLTKMGEHPAEFILSHAPQIGHIQFADCPGRGQPGTGQMDFSALFKAVTSSGYQGWLGAEYKPVGTTADSLQWLPQWG